MIELALYQSSRIWMGALSTSCGNRSWRRQSYLQAPAHPTSPVGVLLTRQFVCRLGKRGMRNTAPGYATKVSHFGNQLAWPAMICIARLLQSSVRRAVLPCSSNWQCASSEP